MLSFGACSLPPDLALKACDTLTLYKALASHQGSIAGDLSYLEPTIFFLDPVALCQKDIVHYEAALKSVVSGLVNDPKDLTASLSGIIQTLEDPKLARIPWHVLEAAPPKATFQSNLIHLLSDLHIAENL